MASEIRLPEELEGFTEGTVIEWFKKVGDEVAVGDELLEIEADKSNLMHEAEEAGVLIGVAAEDGDTLEPGALLGWIGEAGENPPNGEAAPSEEGAGETAEASPELTPATAATPAPAAAPNPSITPSGRLKSSPLARRIASELGVDITVLRGTGPGGRIVKADVETAASAPPPAVAAPVPFAVSAEAEKVPLTRLQSTVARRMVESKVQVPHFYLRAEIEMTAAVEARRQLKADSGDAPVPSFNDFVVKAAALTLGEHPRVNASFAGDHFVLHPQVDVGIAVSTGDGLVVPVIRGADRLGLREISAEARRLAGAANEGKISAAELEGGTFTVSNLGMYGVTGFDAVVNPPQAAILSVGAIRETVIVRNGEMSPGHVLEVGLSCDHRIVYGADGAAFLADLRRKLENPISLAL